MQFYFDFKIIPLCHTLSNAFDISRHYKSCDTTTLWISTKCTTCIFQHGDNTKLIPDG